MSMGKTESVLAARLEALRRDVTVSFGQLAAQIKSDMIEMRSRLEALEQRVGALEREIYTQRQRETESEQLNG